jgi:fumarate reductase subunit D
MKPPRHLALPAYLVALLLVAFPAMDTALAIAPARSGELAWRLGSAGLLSRALMTPLLGLLVALGVAAALEHRRVLIGLAGVAGMLVLGILSILPVVLLDTVEMRSLIAARGRATFDVAAMATVAKLCAAAAVGGAIAASAGLAARRRAQAPAPLSSLPGSRPASAVVERVARAAPPARSGGG